MTTLHHDLQRLIDKEAAKRNTDTVLRAVQSGHRQIDFPGSAGEDSSDRFYIGSITKMFCG